MSRAFRAHGQVETYRNIGRIYVMRPDRVLKEELFIKVRKQVQGRSVN